MPLSLPISDGAEVSVRTWTGWKLSASRGTCMPGRKEGGRKEWEKVKGEEWCVGRLMEGRREERAEERAVILRIGGSGDL